LGPSAAPPGAIMPSPSHLHAPGCSNGDKPRRASRPARRPETCPIAESRRRPRAPPVRSNYARAPASKGLRRAVRPAGTTYAAGYRCASAGYKGIKIIVTWRADPPGSSSRFANSAAVTSRAERARARHGPQGQGPDLSRPRRYRRRLHKRCPLWLPALLAGGLGAGTAGGGMARKKPGRARLVSCPARWSMKRVVFFDGAARDHYFADLSSTAVSTWWRIRGGRPRQVFDLVAATLRRLTRA
jgi:hypothetical protein